MFFDFTFLVYSVLGIYLFSTLILFTAGYYLIRKAFRIFKSFSASTKESRREHARDEKAHFSFQPVKV